MPDYELDLSPPYASMTSFYQDVERNMTLVLAAYSDEGLTPTCRAGCDACCHQLVMTTVAEARISAEAVRQVPDARQAPIRERLNTWLDRTQRLRAHLQAGAEADLEQLVEGLAADYWHERIPCPFLDDGHCAIYEARPLACRHHYSLSDPALCAGGDEAAIDRMETMEEAFFFAQEAIPEDEAEIGMFPELVSLALAEARSNQRGFD